MAIRGANLAKLSDPGGTVPFVFSQTTAAGTSTYSLQVGHRHRLGDMRVIKAWGIMTGAGAAADTVKLTDGTNDITNTVDVSALADKAYFDFNIDDAYYKLQKDDTLKVVTASDALCEVYVMVVRV